MNEEEDNVGWLLRNDMHGEEVGFVSFSTTAIARIRDIIPPRAWLGQRRFTSHGGGSGGIDVLAFGILKVRPQSHVKSLLPAVDPTPFDRFVREQLEHIGRLPEAFAEDNARITKLRCLSWLAHELSAPLAYWNHLGWEGLDREFAFGFDAEGHHSMSFFNEMEIQPATYPPDRPRSAMTACLWHVGATAQNLNEAAYPGELRAFERLA